ncbi:MAG TPA: hypothetical protein VLN45_05075 [Ignavibacteriaceae bacterium]|nr:hypothetical protein [Ignavibacteriaceae bacterium]
MKALISFIALTVFCTFSYSQSDEIKLFKQNDPLFGKVIIIRNNTVEFKQDSTEFLYEFHKKDINYLKSFKGDTIWFRNNSNDIVENEPGETVSEDFNSDSFIIVRYKRLTLFFNYTFTGNHEISISNESAELDVTDGISIGVEVDLIKGSEEKIKLGMGLLYQFPRKQKEVEGDFNFIPLYAFLKLSFINSPDVRVYAIPELGYNFYNGDKDYSGPLELNGGVYTAVGFGILVKNNLDLRFLYQVNRGTVSHELLTEDIKVVYSSFGFQCGYYF